MNRDPALKSALLISGGIIAGRYFDISPFTIYTILSFTVLLSIIFFILRRATVATQILMFISLIGLGFLQHEISERVPPNHIIFQTPDGQKVRIKGYLIRDPVNKPGHFELLLESITLQKLDSLSSIQGKVLIQSDSTVGQKLKYGDIIEVQGILERPTGQRNPGGFDYRAHLARRDIHLILKQRTVDALAVTGQKYGNPLLRKLIYPARRKIIQTINGMTHPENQPLLRALLIGDRSMITPETRDAFARAGIVHVLAVSGLHVGFVLLILMTVTGLLRLPYAVQIIGTILGLILFALITESRDPVVRAVIMAALYLLGTLLERRPRSFNILGVAALIILLWRPRDLFDPGFQLSFTAVASILFFYHRLDRLTWVKTIRRHVGKKWFLNNGLNVILASTAAQIGLLPLTAIYFNRIPTWSVLLNIAAIPMAGIIVALGFTSLIFSFHPWISSTYGVLNNLIISVFTRLFVWIGQHPFSHVNVPPPDVFVTLTYGSCLLLLAFWSDLVWRKRFIMLCLLGSNLVVWNWALDNGLNNLHWIQFDVGQGDAALLRLPKGENVLIDGGPKWPGFDSGERIIAQYLTKEGIRHLDAVILTHPHDDHLGGLIAILENFEIRRVIHSPIITQSNLTNTFCELIRTKEITQTIVMDNNSLFFPGVRLDLIAGSGLKNLKPDDDDINNSSMITRVAFGQNRLLFMGDVESETEQVLLRSGHPIVCDGLKVAHHGSATSTTLSFLNRTNPRISVISAGRKNRFGHPSKIVLDRLQKMNVQIHRTDLQGAVIFESDGTKLTHVQWR